MTPQPPTLTKAARIFHEGRVEPPRPALLYTVRGDTGTYDVTLGEDGTMLCSCPAGRWCSHQGAALLAREAAEGS